MTPIGKLRITVAALRLIAGQQCRNYTTGIGSCSSRINRYRVAKFTEDRWCDSCIAYHAIRKIVKK
jgi:hypothetical protein